MSKICFSPDVRHNLWEIKSISALPNGGHVVGIALRGYGISEWWIP